MVIRLMLAVSAAVWTQGCSLPTAPRQGDDTLGRAVQGKLERANQLTTTRSALELEGYVMRHDLDSLQLSGQGFYFSIWGQGQGKPPREGETAQCIYTLSLLEGEPVERIGAESPVSITLGRRDWPAGLEMLLLQMLPGQEALLLLPSHLGYGMEGKGDLIPPNSCLVYRLKLLSVAQ